MSLRIVPLCMGVLEVSGAVLQSNRKFFETIDSACFAWLILGGPQTILVDSGPAGPEWGGAYHRVMRRAPDQYPVPALRKLGLKPGDIDGIVLTHLHWDHVYGCADIPNVPIYVQGAEIAYAKSPFPRDARAYEADLGSPGLAPLWERFVSLDGEAEIMPGVRVIPTPGHTPGSQAVLAETGKGVHALVGDTINLYSSLEFDPPWPPGIFVNLEDFYASARRLLREADVIVPGHDPAVIGRTFPEP